MEILNDHKGSIVKVILTNDMNFIGVVDFYSAETNVLHLKRVGMQKSNVTWHNEATISEESIREIDSPTEFEMNKYLKNDRDLVKNGSVH
ncbi:hypothetical protein EVB55_061 [Rhizobium phage RHph_Y68]|uniref:Uncharacterized protein n=1 Tax=Rhizobium phage RHph_Y68 TaxID=2509787 RepID=A0A7S5R328_9CAUD|nr:hypothetical protein PP934_gp061 [Rhizobium phage RHph_Y68]QIG67996.1 hypothetical protein EVB55_061 [Rhizobium phage RHph_Y68]